MREAGNLQLYNYRRECIGSHKSLPPGDVDLIIAHALGIPRLELMLHDARGISTGEAASISTMLARREGREPLQYIFGEAPFRNLSLSVGTGVLIPRFETEMLVELALEHICPSSSAMDLGTGSGAIPISLALEMPGCHVTATDISDIALEYARANIARHGAYNVRLLRGDLFDALPTDERFDLITGNLPYVSTKIYASLDAEVRDFEPESAFHCAEGGMELIRRTIEQAPGHLNGRGILILEFSPEQEGETVAILTDNRFKNIRIVKDLNSRARFAQATRP